MGVPASKTMTWRQCRRARRIARRYGLEWGGTWTTRLDAMHFEVAVTPARARVLIKRLDL
jgi:hypothetical protein